MYTLSYVQGTPIHVETNVLSMCQLGVHVWMASQHGTLIANTTTLYTISVPGPQLCTIKECDNDLWCGNGLNTLNIITFPHGNSQPYVRVTFNAHTSSTDIPQNSSIMQLQSCPHSSLHVCSSQLWKYCFLLEC